MIDVSMLESTLATMGWVVSNYLNAGTVPLPLGNENFTAAPSGTFRTADGLLNIAANESYQYEKLCDLLRRPDLKTDPHFADRDFRKKNREAINREIQAVLLTRPAAEWETLLIEAGVPAGRVLSVPEILNHPHLAERQFITRFPTSIRHRRSPAVDIGFRMGTPCHQARRQPFPSIRTPGYRNSVTRRIEDLRASGII